MTEPTIQIGRVGLAEVGSAAMRAPVTITELLLHRHELPTADGSYDMSISSVQTLVSYVVELRTDVGVVGFGEVCPLGPGYQPEFAGGAAAAIAELAPTVIGLDPTHTTLLNRKMDVALNGHNYAKSAIDVACWDLTGKLLDRSVADLLGGTEASSVPTYWGLMPDTVEATVAKAASLVDSGYRRLQLKTGGRPLADDIACMRALAAELPPTIKLLADANRGWTMRDALEFSIACKDVPLALEQPCRSLDEHRQLVGRTNHPVFLDESTVDVATVVSIAGQGIAQGFGMKLSRVGGLTKLRAVRDVCDAMQLPMTVDDTWGGDLVASAICQMGSTLDPALYEGSWISAPYTAENYPVRSTPITVEAGRIRWPQGPGLGVEIDTSDWHPPVATFTT